ncbi:MAG: hypothetical protein ACPLQO_07920 [Desulfotomaculales bacterium]
MTRILEELRAELLQLEKELAANSSLPSDCSEEGPEEDREDQLFSQIARYLLISGESLWEDIQNADFVEAITAFLEPVPVPEGFVNRILERIYQEQTLPRGSFFSI